MSRAGRKIGFGLALLAALGAASFLILSRPPHEAKDSAGRATAGPAPRVVPAPVADAAVLVPAFEEPALSSSRAQVVPAPSTAVPDIVGKLVGSDGRALTGSVTAHGPDDSFDSAQSDFERGFRIFQPRAGRYDLTVRAVGLMQSALVVADLGAGKPEEPLVIEMVRAGVVEGLVSFPSPASVVPCAVHVMPEVQVERLRLHLEEVLYPGDAVPDAEGRFTLALHPTIASTVTCTAALPWKPRIRLQGVLPSDGPLRFEFTEEMLAGSMIEGTVTDAAAKADMTGFHVRLWSAQRVQDEAVLPQRPDRDDGVIGPGRFRFDTLAGGDYFVSAESLGYIADVKGPIPAGSPGTPVHLELHTPGDLAVTVLDEKRQPVKGAAVRCGIVAMPWPKLEGEGLAADLYDRSGTVPEADGRLTLRNLAPGEFWIAAQEGDRVAPATRVQIRDGLVTPIELVLQRIEGRGDVTVHVIDTHDRDVSGAYVGATLVLAVPGMGLPPHRSWRTGADGCIQYHGVPSGLLLVEVMPNVEFAPTIVGVGNGGTTQCLVRILRYP